MPQDFFTGLPLIRPGETVYFPAERRCSCGAAIHATRQENDRFDATLYTFRCTRSGLRCGWAISNRQVSHSYVGDAMLRRELENTIDRLAANCRAADSSSYEKFADLKLAEPWELGRPQPTAPARRGPVPVPYPVRKLIL